MTKRMYAIRDKLTGFFPPIISENDAVAMRDFERALLKENSDTPAMVDDFSIWLVGYFRTEDGCIESVEPELIMRGSEVCEKYGLSN